LSQRDYVDTKRTAVASEVEIGDKVLLRNSKTNKLSPNYGPNPCEGVDRKGVEVTIRSWCRNKEKCVICEKVSRKTLGGES